MVKESENIRQKLNQASYKFLIENIGASLLLRCPKYLGNDQDKITLKLIGIESKIDINKELSIICLLRIDSEKEQFLLDSLDYYRENPQIKEQHIKRLEQLKSFPTIRYTYNQLILAQTDASIDWFEEEINDSNRQVFSKSDMANAFFAGQDEEILDFEQWINKYTQL